MSEMNKQNFQINYFESDFGRGVSYKNIPSVENVINDNFKRLKTSENKRQFPISAKSKQLSFKHKKKNNLHKAIANYERILRTERKRSQEDQNKLKRNANKWGFNRQASRKLREYFSNGPSRDEYNLNCNISNNVPNWVEPYNEIPGIPVDYSSEYNFCAKNYEYYETAAERRFGINSSSAPNWSRNLDFMENVNQRSFHSPILESCSASMDEQIHSHPLISVKPDRFFFNATLRGRQFQEPLLQFQSYNEFPQQNWHIQETNQMSPIPRSKTEYSPRPERYEYCSTLYERPVTPHDNRSLSDCHSNASLSPPLSCQGGLPYNSRENSTDGIDLCSTQFSNDGFSDHFGRSSMYNLDWKYFSNSYLQIVIVDHNDYEGRIYYDVWQKMQKLLYAYLSHELENTQNSKIGLFGVLPFQNGFQIITCDNMESFNFIKRFVQIEINISPQMRYEAILARELPRRSLAKLWLKLSCIDDNTALDILKTQNSKFFSEDWVLINIRERNKTNGKDLYLSVSFDSCERLRKEEGKICFNGECLRMILLD